jgi:hypothetical protein
MVVPRGSQRSAEEPAQEPRPAHRQPPADWRAAVASQLQKPGRGATAGGAAAAGAAPDLKSGYELRPVTPVGLPALEASDWANAELGPAVVGPVATPLTTPPSGARPSGSPRQAAAAAKRPASARRQEAVGSSSGFGPASPWTLVASVGTFFGSLLGRPTPRGPSPGTIAYRTFFGLLGRWTDWISETSYTVSFIIIILAVASGMIGRHSLAAFGFWAVVALNAVGLAGDVTSLVTLSFRKNPLQGTLFLVPPFTLYYLWSDWHRYRDTIVRMRTALLTLAAVAAAYVFVPWLHGGGKAEGRIVAAVKRTVDTVEKSVTGRQDAFEDGLKKARSWLREVPRIDPSSLPGLPGTRHPASGHKP